MQNFYIVHVKCLSSRWTHCSGQNKAENAAIGGTMQRAQLPVNEFFCSVCLRCVCCSMFVCSTTIRIRLPAILSFSARTVRARGNSTVFSACSKLFCFETPALRAKIPQHQQRTVMTHQRCAGKCCCWFISACINFRCVGYQLTTVFFPMPPYS